MSQPDNRLGAHYEGDGRCRFIVWAPKAQQLDVHIYAPTEQVVTLESRPRGYFEGVVTGVEPGSTYKYRLDGGDEAGAARRRLAQQHHPPHPRLLAHRDRQLAKIARLEPVDALDDHAVTPRRRDLRRPATCLLRPQLLQLGLQRLDLLDTGVPVGRLGNRFGLRNQVFLHGLVGAPHVLALREVVLAAREEPVAGRAETVVERLALAANTKA